MKRKMSGSVGELMRSFDAGHQATYGAPYLASFKRDVHLLNELLDVYSPQFANELLSAFWLAQKRARRDDSYIVGRSRPDVRGFRASIPNLIREFEFDTPPAQRAAHTKEAGARLFNDVARCSRCKADVCDCARYDIGDNSPLSLDPTKLRT